MIEYSIFKKQQLSLPLQQLKQASIDLENAKKQKNRNSWIDAKTRLRKAAQQCVDIEPTIAYLWLKAIGNGLDNQIREAWQPDITNSIQDWGSLNLTADLPEEITHFPPGSWALQFTFTLRKPYISQDDSDFYILDNPVKKEWVFKVPYVAPSQWKGALRAAMVQELVAKLRNGGIDEQTFIEKRLQYYHLFGNEKDGTTEFLNRVWARHRVGEPSRHEKEHHKWQEGFEARIKEVGEEFETMLREKDDQQGDIEGFQGYLHFYPTYFDQIGLEVINPHPRDTGAGKLPIYFECVPDDGTNRNTNGIFTLFYVPLGGQELSPKDAEKRAAKDLQTIAEGIRAMMTRYGFGAKTSSGFGVAEVDHTGATIKPEEFRKHWQKAWVEAQ